jgi:hypothetical protein
MREELLEGLEILRILGLFDQDIKDIEKQPEQDQINIFMSCTELSCDDEDLPELVVDLYNVFEKERSDADELSSVKSYLETPTKEERMSEEKNQEIINKILEIFRVWEKGGFATVEVPPEITFKEIKTMFLTTLEAMPFKQKMAGGMDEEIYKLSTDLLKRKSKKRGESAISQEEAAAKLKALLEVANIVNEYLESPVTLKDTENLNLTETQVLEMIFDVGSITNFADMMKEDVVAKMIFQLAVDRKISSIVVKGKKRQRTLKKWDGEGEPFKELAPDKTPSMTYKLWKKILDKDQKLATLNKWATKEFGTKGNGDPRDVTRVLVKMGKKIADFYIITIGETISVKTA